MMPEILIFFLFLQASGTINGTVNFIHLLNQLYNFTLVFIDNFALIYLKSEVGKYKTQVLIVINSKEYGSK